MRIRAPCASAPSSARPPSDVGCATTPLGSQAVHHLRTAASPGGGGPELQAVAVAALHLVRLREAGGRRAHAVAARFHVHGPELGTASHLAELEASRGHLDAHVDHVVPTVEVGRRFGVPHLDPNRHLAVPDRSHRDEAVGDAHVALEARPVPDEVGAPLDGRVDEVELAVVRVELGLHDLRRLHGPSVLARRSRIHSAP